MLSIESIGFILGLSSAIGYGSGDFLGGMATRRLNPYQVLAITSFVGFFVMTGFWLAGGESLPSSRSMILAGLGGACGTVGLAMLFTGLARGGSAIVSPVSAVVGAILPVLFTALKFGFPDSAQLLGIGIAIPGIWLVTYSSGSRIMTNSNFLLGLVAGVGFGMFFILISYVEVEESFGSLAFLKLVAFSLSLLILLFNRKKLKSIHDNHRSIWIAAASGLLDPAANALYLASSRLIRLDLAVILVSLFPSITVLLSRWVLKEKITRIQWLGISLCMIAIALISIG